MDAYKALFRYQAGIPQNAAFDQEAQGLQDAGLNDTQRQALQMMQQHAQGGFNLGQAGHGRARQPARRLRHAVERGGAGAGPGRRRLHEPGDGRGEPDRERRQNGQNPYLDARTSRRRHKFTQAAVPAMTSQFANAGRTGSNAYANALGSQLNQGLGHLATNIYGGGYATDRANQMSALGMQGQLGQQDVQQHALRRRALRPGPAAAAPGHRARRHRLRARLAAGAGADAGRHHAAAGALPAHQRRARGVRGLPDGAEQHVLEPDEPAHRAARAGRLGPRHGRHAGRVRAERAGRGLHVGRAAEDGQAKVGSVDIHDWRYLWEPEGTATAGRWRRTWPS
jgi:hypothetical protein